MRIECLFSGIILPLLAIPWELYAYSLDRSLYLGALVVSIAEIVSLLLVKKITKNKLRMSYNRGIFLSIPMIIIMIIFPSSSPIIFKYPLLLFPAIIGGICEEYIYRGYILEEGKYDVYIQAVLWSFNHILDGPIFMIYTLFIGVILGLISKKYGIMPCIIAHVCSNVLRLM
ncbi:abortive infection protein [Sulfolobus sp. A20]|uniref:CPBP family intramembrane glutamic endopeptidase n=1 Tax=Sulfolobaceae TaxID=118883 RepID=UPI000845FF23|nr:MULTISPECIES: CPBP family intramembrane glutamic endopeptidase [unclassified Sulfolobus]TRM79535.1 CPBP family intramembrane metalloprotease [Sulfolobus sp. B5]TRM82287.1 CPBP family intramembrane metalloprotease [Sulfolobus sp. D5]TRM87819.1 CPBP family intramembrane metalloprotease [Sulfolobus sp. E3]TRN00716.1 CPBP family intramembrane metalloprotease [Sulfolobus sp. E1]TRN00740.1 CPBP family intramembrane metalloprotease [Sulfolobus sp. F1]